MDASVLIPTHARPEKLAACLGALARQTWPSGSFEVAVGIDGDDGVSAEAANRAWNEAGGHPQSLCVATFPKRGYIHARHRLLPTLNGRIYISMNELIGRLLCFSYSHRIPCEVRRFCSVAAKPHRSRWVGCAGTGGNLSACPGVCSA